LQFELIALALVVLMVYLTISGYAALPDRIPTHFNAQGIPDGYGNKNELLVYPGMAVLTYLLITGISLALAVAGNLKNLINLPSKMKEAISESGIEKLRIVMVRSLFIIKVLVLALLTFLLYGSFEIALSRADSLGYWPFVFVAVLLCVIGFMFYSIYRITKTREE
jgi:uncharacterized membrane protein